MYPQLANEDCYKAIVSKDYRFNGQLYYAVTSTGIYCKPSCKVKNPLLENCRFFSSHFMAESAGYRPCKRCKPDVVENKVASPENIKLIQNAMDMIKDGFLEESRLEDLAKQLKITSRHLRRLFQLEIGISPIKYAQNYRLLVATQLIKDSKLSITQIAFDAGFGSIRQFNNLFKKEYLSSPQKSLNTNFLKQQDVIKFELSYKEPFTWNKLIKFLDGRSILGIEQVENNSYQRTIRVFKDGTYHEGWMIAENLIDKNVISITLDRKLSHIVLYIIERIKHLFDLDCSPDKIAQKLNFLENYDPGLRIPGAFDSFEIAVTTILMQQTTLKSAKDQARCFTLRFGALVSTPFPYLTHVFPLPKDIACLGIEVISNLGISKSKATAIVALARNIVNGSIILSPNTDIQNTMINIAELPGVEECMAEYIAMRILNWPDAFPASDLTILKALGTRSSSVARQYAKEWKPWRSYAAMHFITK